MQLHSLDVILRQICVFCVPKQGGDMQELICSYGGRLFFREKKKPKKKLMSFLTLDIGICQCFIYHVGVADSLVKMKEGGSDFRKGAESEKHQGDAKMGKAFVPQRSQHVCPCAWSLSVVPGCRHLLLWSLLPLSHVYHGPERALRDYVFQLPFV